MDGDRPNVDAPGLIQARPAQEAGLAWCGDPVRRSQFSTFYGFEFHRLVGFLMKAVGATAQDAADAAQVAFVEAWKKWENLTNPKAWVRTVAMRSFYRSIPMREVSMADPPETVDETAEMELELSERTALAHLLLDHLPATQRIVVAYSTDGFSDKEIAAELGMTAAAVRQNRCRARATLKNWLQASGKDGDA